MYLILPTSQDNPDAMSDIDLAVIPVDDGTLATLKKWKQVRDTAEKDAGENLFLSVEMFNYWADYYAFYSDDRVLDYEQGEGSDMEALDTALAQGMPVMMEPEKFKALNLTQQRTDGDQIVIGKGGVWWTTYPKHQDYKVWTRVVDWETLGIK
jgi:hypothetical protein